MEFCPTCGNMLQIEPARNGLRMRFFCPTCPYVCPITNKITKKQHLVRKELEPVFSAEDSMKFADKAATSCPRCQNGEAYYRQMQIRSADEPMTTFYRCCNDKCKHEWRED